MLVAKTGNEWTLQRGYGLSAPSDHSSPTLWAHCMARDFFHGVSNWSWTWDTARDPHGVNSDGTTVRVAWDYDHPVPRTDVTLGGMPSYDSNCQSGACYAVRADAGSMGDPPNRYVSLAPSFSGASGTASYIERAQDHPSWLQDNAARSERQWFTDGRPLAPLMDISDAAISVSGQLYRVTSTTTDGDNLGRVGYNIYVVKTSATTLLAGRKLLGGQPLSDLERHLPAGLDCAAVHDHAAGREWDGLCFENQFGRPGSYVYQRPDNQLPIRARFRKEHGFPGGSVPLWTWSANVGYLGGERRGHSRWFVRLSWRNQSQDSANVGVLRDAAVDRRE